VIQFIVITKGAERVAEVGARFTLDAMPGKQMAIDADLNAGLIDEIERASGARSHRRGELLRRDGRCSKFVKGDAIARIIITLINLDRRASRSACSSAAWTPDAIDPYSLLSVGDGLVSQIPALLLSVSTGLIVTRSANDGDMAAPSRSKLGQHRRALQIGGGSALALCLVPGLPKLPFLLVGSVVLVAAQRLPKPGADAAEQPATRRSRRSRRTRPRRCSARCGSTRSSSRSRPTSSTSSTPTVATCSNGSAALRRKVALELGIVMPAGAHPRRP
jgi:flagellar biosynthesis protein FlhA